MSITDFPRHPLTFGPSPLQHLKRLSQHLGGAQLAGLIDLVGSGEIGRDSTVLYAHLGGQPAINAYHRLWS